MGYVGHNKIIQDDDNITLKCDFAITNEALNRAVYQYLTGCVERELQSMELQRSCVRDIVKEMVYTHKDEILDRIITRAVKELVKKGLPILLERTEEDGRRKIERNIRKS